jgi:hypothetical protein
MNIIAARRNWDLDMHLKHTLARIADDQISPTTSSRGTSVRFSHHDEITISVPGAVRSGISAKHFHVIFQDIDLPVNPFQSLTWLTL